ncbi:hypothetical protein D1AOALGA4SA_8438 [Olavius algarvensis Delta 1 endosymbiont]|nr:hypothetical protein D1AOALGA4SA_8438 [Olavius algarvensis Delta 1 endosymbiont]
MIQIQLSKRFDPLRKSLDRTQALCRRIAEININHLPLQIENKDR